MKYLFKMDETAEKVREGGEGRSGEEEEDEQEQQQQQLYGIKSCSPGRLQGCNNHKVALVWLCWLSVTQGIGTPRILNIPSPNLLNYRNQWPIQWRVLHFFCEGCP